MPHVIDYLRDDFTEPVRDPLWKNIYLSPGFERLLSCRRVWRIDGIRQLGPTYLLYPGATHTRLAHSLGVFHLSHKILQVLLRQPECPPVSLEGVKAFLAASLLHDLGHFPYAHSLKELADKSHETLTGEIVREGEIADVLKNTIGADPESVAAIVDLTMTTENPEIRFFRQILSGVLDPDKLDYLNRDAFFCGIPYGLQDIDFALNQVVPRQDGGLAITEKGVSAIENILFSKYLMYRNVYWHKTVRMATAVIKKALFLAIKDGAIRIDELYGLTDDEFRARFTTNIHPAFRLIPQAETRGHFTVVHEEPFDAANPRHQELLTLSQRYEQEKRLAENLSTPQNPLSEEEITLDLPHKLSLESELLVVNGDRETRFIESPTVFKQPVIDAVSAAPRKFRLILPADRAKITLPEDILVK